VTRAGWLLAAALTAAAVGAARWRAPVQVTGYDAGFYLAMTENPLSKTPRTLTAPYAYRLVPSLLLHFVPGRIPKVYAAYTALAAWATVLVFLKALRRLGFRAKPMLMAGFLFVSSWVSLRFAFYDPVHVDITYSLILAGAFYGLAARSDPIFALCLLIGAATREYFLILIPTYYLRRCRRGILDGRAAARTAAVAAGPIAVFFALRLFLPVSNRDFAYGEHALYFGRMFLIHWPRMVHAAFNVFGVGIFIIVFGLGAAGRFLTRHSWVAAYLFLSLICLALGGADRCRILFTAWPAVLLLAAAVVREQNELYRSQLLWGLLILLQLLLMRWHLPLEPATYRQLWWSNVSFLPRSEFLVSSNRYLMAGLAFLAAAGGLRLRQISFVDNNPEKRG